MNSKILVLFVAIATVADARSVSPPPADQTALMARYIVNEAEWTSMATLSIRDNSKGYPFVSLVSSSDGALGDGNGVPYIFLTPLDFAGQDVEKDERATLMMSLVQGDFCKEKGYDPMDPRCARVILTGKIKQVSETDKEYETAKTAMFTRHPWLSHMPENHHFYIAKLDIETVVVLAKFGNPKYVQVNEYYKAAEKDIDEYARSFQ